MSSAKMGLARSILDPHITVAETGALPFAGALAPELRRRAEHVAGRELARRAITAATGEQFSGPIGTGEHGEPLWPPGLCGSISHCHTYIVAAVSPTATTIGIDVETTSRVTAAVYTRITTADERDHHTQDDPVVRAAVFCAKEAVHKAWFHFECITLKADQIQIYVDDSGDFTAIIDSGGCPTQLEGRHRSTGEHTAAAITW